MVAMIAGLHLASGIKWSDALLPDTPVLEIVVRGTIVYLALFFLLRFVLRREAAGMSVTDLLVVVLIADAAQNAMAGGYNSVPDGILLVLVIVLWAFALDWLSYHVPWFEHLVKPRKLPLVRDGCLLRANMRRELVTFDELMSELRLQGHDDVAKVKLAYMESDGRISVLADDGHDSGGGPEKKALRG